MHKEEENSLGLQCVNPQSLYVPRGCPSHACNPDCNTASHLQGAAQEGSGQCIELTIKIGYQHCTRLLKYENSLSLYVWGRGPVDQPGRRIPINARENMGRLGLYTVRHSRRTRTWANRWGKFPSVRSRVIADSSLSWSGCQRRRAGVAVCLFWWCI